MKIGFNEATALECKGQSLMADLEACEKYGFDYIEIRFDCVKDYLKEHTLEELADWFKNHHLKPWAYNTLIFFNQRDEAGVKEIDEETDFIIKVCEAIGMKMLITVPSFDVKDKSKKKQQKDSVIFQIKSEKTSRFPWSSAEHQTVRSTSSEQHTM